MKQPCVLAGIGGLGDFRRCYLTCEGVPYTGDRAVASRFALSLQKVAHRAGEFSDFAVNLHNSKFYLLPPAENLKNTLAEFEKEFQAQSF